MRFDDFLTRTDEQDLAMLIGRGVLRILRALDPNGFTIQRQRDLLLNQKKPQNLLSNISSRRILLDLLRPEEAVSLCQQLGLSQQSPYEQLKSASISGAKFQSLLAFFDLSPLASEEVTSVRAETLVSPSYPLFKHQLKAANKVKNLLYTSPRRVLLHMPTGAGKTRTAMNIIAEHFRSFPDRSVVWLAHNEELCEQAASEFENAWSSLGSHEVVLRRFWDQRSLNIEEIRGDFIVAGLPKIFSLLRSSILDIGRLGSKVSLVVMDEAHQAIAPTYKLILDSLVLPFEKTSLLGLSATPGRTWNDVAADAELADFFHRQKVKLEVDGYSNPVSYLIDSGYLSKPNFLPLNVPSNIAITEAEKNRIQNELDIPASVLERLAEDEIRNIFIVDEILKLTQRHKRILVFATTVAHSDLLAYILRARGVWSKSLTGKTPSSERLKIIEEYKEDTIESRVICNFGVLTTGFDAPKTSAAVIARPTKSLVLYSQMMGRAIRGVKAGGNTNSDIITVVDTQLPGFGDIGDAFLNWEDVWE